MEGRGSGDVRLSTRQILFIHQRTQNVSIPEIARQEGVTPRAVYLSLMRAIVTLRAMRHEFIAAGADHKMIDGWLSAVCRK